MKAVGVYLFLFVGFFCTKTYQKLESLCFSGIGGFHSFGCGELREIQCVCNKEEFKTINKNHSGRHSLRHGMHRI